MMNKLNFKKAIKSFICFSFVLIILFLSLPTAPTSVPEAKAKNAERKKVMVSLGDSYSSGEGLGHYYNEDEPLSYKITDKDWLAHRSEISWPGRLVLDSKDGTMAKNHNDIWYFAAASGAETKHILDTRQKKEYYKEDGLYDSSEPLPKQIDIFKDIEKGTVDYVTLTIGGNDAGFADIIMAAALDTPYLGPNGVRSKINEALFKLYKKNGIRDALRKTYKAIENAAGKQATIIVAGYPKLIDPFRGAPTFGYLETFIINEATSLFNKEIEKVVNSCKSNGMNIHFVSVEEKFENHGAYASTPYINGIEPPNEQDLKDFKLKKFSFVSSASFHPNDDGAQVYADCVQALIDELEKPVRTTSDERDVVLVLDVSGSMDGTPIEETKEAAIKFVQTVLKEDASIGIVLYHSYAEMVADFSMDEDYLIDTINGIEAQSQTNIEDGLAKAEEMLSTSNARKKIIVMMTDGMPNCGKTGDNLISYADQIKEDGTYIYSLGFFYNLYESEKADAQELLGGIASEGCHYEVSDAESLVYFFGDIADQISGQNYIYIRIACPVDVTVKYNGQTLTSKWDNRTRTDFGTLTFEENAEEPADEGSDNRIKILRLKEGVDYDIKIEGNGRGRMDYSIGFMDKDGEYSDIRKFNRIKITRDTEIDTVATRAKKTVLKVDEDGDGKYDFKYEATKNGRGKLIKINYALYITVAVIAVVAVLALIFVLKLRASIKKAKREMNLYV